ncbi:hypothetical protein F0562_002661 [Nyssa sinensis]|uniref:Uncharacterized protein n=1 Tax=Nyssa sinensis TaxID=561372 RepID=A0A5J5BWX4_9ASTE|nr:hypothetical protein F0562_002661 [Nyssa sinensis]
MNRKIWKSERNNWADQLRKGDRRGWSRRSGEVSPSLEIFLSDLRVSLSGGFGCLEVKEAVQKYFYGAQMNRTDVIGSGRRRVLLFFSFWV